MAGVDVFPHLAVRRPVGLAVGTLVGQPVDVLYLDVNLHLLGRLLHQAALVTCQRQDRRIVA